MVQQVVGVLVVLASAFAASATGFGFNLVSAPLLTFLYSPRDVVIMTLALGLVASGLLLARAEVRRDVDWGTIRPLLLASLGGMPLGWVVLAWSRSQVLRAAIAALTASFAILMLVRFRPRLRDTGRATVAIGAFSGFLSTSTSLNGPPIVFYLLAREFPKNRFRATMIAYVFLATLASLVVHAVGGAVSPALLGMIYPLLPPVLLGFAGGLVVVERLTSRAFETMVLGFLVVVGLLGIVSSLM